MKFGGSSVADHDRLQQVAARVVARAQTQPVVVVVSAMGKTTNGLLAQAHALAENPPLRELDMLLSTGEREAMTLLAIAIHACGHKAISLTGSQCGIITDHQHSRARIIEVRPFRIQDELAAGHIVIVGGFQGVSYKREVTTLGRGGSDTTAVALAAALGADCEIYSDVDGVYAADPHEVADACRIPEISYESMQALARSGAKVLHTAAVQLAEQQKIAIYARHVRPDQPGETIIRNNPAAEPGVLAISSDAAVAHITLTLHPDAKDLCAQLCAELGPLGLRAVRITNSQVTGILSRTQRTDADETLVRLGTLARNLGRNLSELHCEDHLALVSCIGAGLEDRPDILPLAANTLRLANISVHSCITDHRSLAFAVPRHLRCSAVQLLHAALRPSCANTA